MPFPVILLIITFKPRFHFQRLFGKKWAHKIKDRTWVMVEMESNSSQAHLISCWGLGIRPQWTVSWRSLFQDQNSSFNLKNDCAWVAEPTVYHLSNCWISDSHQGPGWIDFILHGVYIHIPVLKFLSMGYLQMH